MHALEKDMATHSSILALRILWTEEPGGLLSGGHTELDTTEGTQQQQLQGTREQCHPGKWGRGKKSYPQ